MMTEERSGDEDQDDGDKEGRQEVVDPEARDLDKEGGRRRWRIERQDTLVKREQGGGGGACSGWSDLQRQGRNGGHINLLDNTRDGRTISGL